MDFAKNKTFLALIAALLCLCLLMVACGDEQGPGRGEQTSASAQNTTAQGERPGQTTQAGDTQGEVNAETSSEVDGTNADTEQSETQPEPQTVTYTVNVIGSDGNPRRGAMVCVQKDGEQIYSMQTDADGVANMELVPDTYMVSITNLFGEKYDTTGCELTPESTSLTIRLCGLPSEGEEIYAYNAAADDYIAYDARNIAEGHTYITLNADDMTYYLFVSSRGGVFKLSVDQDLPVSIGYYGSTSFVMTESVVPEENNAVCVEVYDDMAFNYAFVIGVKAEDAGVLECELVIEYVSEREMTEKDMPWTDLMPERELPKYAMGSGTIHNFVVDGPEISLVYSESDGYYHVGSADGPVVLVNLGNNSPYMDALTTVCASMRLGVYVYDDQGKLLSKDSYNELIYAYDAVGDGGYYPLDDTLCNMLQVLGDYMGWYDPSSPMYLFGGMALEPANAYLFACVYLQ